MLERFPSVPLITNDPYFSIWCGADCLTAADTTHWSGAPLRIRGMLRVDGKAYRFLGTGSEAVANQTKLEVTPLTTKTVFSTGNVELKVNFTSPLLPGDMDLMSTPVTFLEAEVASIDGKPHTVSVQWLFNQEICAKSNNPQDITGDTYMLMSEYSATWMGRKQQRPLCHSADLTTIDWGYLWGVGKHTSMIENEDGINLLLEEETTLKDKKSQKLHYAIAYDDIVSIDYMGTFCKAWYQRNGMTLTEALVNLINRREKIIAQCDEFDRKAINDAETIGGENYKRIICASFRQVISAHKLIADDCGKPVFLSKENDSNGCVCTLDVTYPSAPLFLIYNPALLKGMLEPILRFSRLPVWNFGFAPHDIGRYPYATGQVYGIGSTFANIDEPKHHGMRAPEGQTYPPLYLYPENRNVYGTNDQMPIEECGNMLILLWALCYANGDSSLAREYLQEISVWADYLARHGTDPKEQLCTDDFGGHNARNANLALKAILGVRCFSELLKRLGYPEKAEFYLEKAKSMADSWNAKAVGECHTYLSLEGYGWSLKYNMVWDRLFGFDLFDNSMVQRDIKLYVSNINRYGTPLDSQHTYSKSDWILWCAAMAEDKDDFSAMIAPVAEYLKSTPNRIPFADWYDTITGCYNRFIARSVQGGTFMPILRKKWKERGQDTASLFVQYQTVNDAKDAYFNKIGAGMGIFIKQSNGHFIAIDGGHPEDGENVMKLLEILAAPNKPVIDAWFLTHPHIDHYGALLEISKIKENAARLAIKKICMDMPTKDFVDENSHYYRNDIGNIEEILKNLEMKSTPIASGDVMIFGEIEIKVAATYTDLMDVMDPNDTSCVLLVRAFNQQITLLGDCYPGMSSVAVNKWHEELKSDIVQLAHHGLRGGSKELYKKIDAPVCLIPNNRKTFDEFHAKYEANSWAYNRAEQRIFAGEGTCVLKLPYHAFEHQYGVQDVIDGTIRG